MGNKLEKILIPFFPHQIALKGMLLYFIALASVSLIFIRYSMPTDFVVMGAVFVISFFGFATFCSKKWNTVSKRNYLMFLFFIALLFRLIWVVFSFLYYTKKTGLPFEHDAADAMGYHFEAVMLANGSWKNTIDYLFDSRETFSDSGYVLYLSTLYRIIGPNIIVARIIKSILGSLLCVLLYKLASRTFGESTGRMTGILACFMPNLIIYCGLHLKETEMLFLTVAFLERADYLLRERKFTFVTVAVPFLLGLSLFTFRTVLGVAALFAFATVIVFGDKERFNKRKRLVIGIYLAAALAMMAGGTLATEVEGYWNGRNENQGMKREQQVSQGYKWAKYATGTVMAPMMFVLPFPTMVDVEQQYNQNVMHGGNYVRNFLGCFVLISLFNSIFVKKDWRDKLLPMSFMAAYLGIICMSGFANAERFLLPGLPMLLLFSADGIAHLNAKNYGFVRIWYLVVPLMSFGWAFFKIGTRGLL